MVTAILTPGAQAIEEQVENCTGNIPACLEDLGCDPGDAVDHLCGAYPDWCSDIAGACDGNPCDSLGCGEVERCVSELLGATPYTICGETRETAEQCAAAAADGDGTSDCGTATAIAYAVMEEVDRHIDDCLNGVPEIPCDPNPRQSFSPPSTCSMNCVTTTYNFVALDDGIPIPDAYLVECQYDIGTQPPLPPVFFPYVVVNDSPNCPVGELSGEAVPLFQNEYAPDPKIVPFIDFVTGGCHWSASIHVYGAGYDSGDQYIPCSHPA